MNKAGKGMAGLAGLWQTIRRWFSPGPLEINDQAHDYRFDLGGGEMIALPLTSSGASPAETHDYRIETAGFMIHPADPQHDCATLRFGFSFTAKTRRKMDGVRVEHVFPGGQSHLLVEDTTPTFQDQMWPGHSAVFPITPENTPWFYVHGDTLFVFRFTIEGAESGSVVMYQPSILPEMLKAPYRIGLPVDP